MSWANMYSVSISIEIVLHVCLVPTFFSSGKFLDFFTMYWVMLHQCIKSCACVTDIAFAEFFSHFATNVNNVNTNFARMCYKFLAVAPITAMLMLMQPSPQCNFCPELPKLAKIFYAVVDYFAYWDAFYHHPFS